jgi:hypothetical protein
MNMNFPDQDTFRAYCVTNSYPTQYNDGLKVALETDLGVSGLSLPDLMRLYFETNGPQYLYP